MLWCYLPNVESVFSDSLLKKFASTFKSIWIASAFKGATGSSQIYTDVGFHIHNHESWLKALSRMEQYDNALQISGWALTGWSRYTHLMELCELMPAGMPSLAACMWTIGATKNSIGSLLGCDGVVTIGDDSAIGQCNFVGNQTFADITLLRNVKEAYRSRILSIKRSTDEVLRLKLSQETRDFVDLQLKTILLIEGRLRSSMQTLFYDDTIDEWFKTHLLPIKNDLNKIVVN